MKKYLSLLLILSCLQVGCAHIPLDKLKERYTDEHSLFVMVKGVNVHYRDQGTGETLLLIHGTGASLHTWDRWTELLSPQYRVVRLDLPAFGLTGPSLEGDYTSPAYVAFLDEFITTLKLADPVIAGNSLGGGIALHYAITHPEKVKKLVLIDSGGYPLEQLPMIFRLGRVPLLNQLIKHVTPRFMVRKNLLEVYGDPSRVTDTLVDRYHELLLRRGNRQAMLDRMGQLQQQPENIPGISMPTLILWGEADQWIPLKNGHRFHQEIKDSRLITYPGLGHVPMEEAPEKTASDLMDWLCLPALSGINAGK